MIQFSEDTPLKLQKSETDRTNFINNTGSRLHHKDNCCLKKLIWISVNRGSIHH